MIKGKEGGYLLFYHDIITDIREEYLKDHEVLPTNMNVGRQIVMLLQKYL